ncbi:MAG TPA: lysylphosphatidylglycerol synthase transmembrane domain-containing protein, partial [Candidatus Tectomicrobia bacterium]
MKKFAILATVLVLVLLYTRIDLLALLQQLRQMNMVFFLLALSLFVPQIFVTALRWQCMVRDVCPMSTLDAARLILAGKALNALVPSKLGEMSKAYFLKTRANLDLSKGGALVVLEKALDVLGLCTLMLIGVLLIPRHGPVETSATLAAGLAIVVVAGLCTCRTGGLQRWLQGKRGLAQRLATLLESWEAILARWKAHHMRLAGIVLLSVGLWLLHLVQIYLFFVALHSSVAIKTVFAYVPLSIFIGLLPLTIGGMGTRDSALILLFAPYESAVVMAGVGVLCSLRYWMDTLLGL